MRFEVNRSALYFFLPSVDVAYLCGTLHTGAAPTVTVLVSACLAFQSVCGGFGSNVLRWGSPDPASLVNFSSRFCGATGSRIRYPIG